MDLTIQYYMDDFIRDNDIDTIVLGCTHYPWIQKNIARIYPDLHVINPSSIIVDTSREIIQERRYGSERIFFREYFFCQRPFGEFRQYDRQHLRRGRRGCYRSEIFKL